MPCPHCDELIRAVNEAERTQRDVDEAAANTIEPLIQLLAVQQNAIDILREVLEQMRRTLRRDGRSIAETAH
jgi:histone H3/H4